MSTSEEESWSSRFAERYGELVPTTSDREIGGTLEPEVGTVVTSILDAVGNGPVPAPEDSVMRESLTLASLLGRRAALLDATPMAGLALAPAIAHSLAPALDLDTLHEPLRIAIVDGYVRGREERAVGLGERRAADAIPTVMLVPRCFAIFFRGVQSSEQLERVIAELGRALLKGDAKACIVDASGLRDPDRERAAQLFSVHATCVMLGVRCIYSGVSHTFIDAAGERGIELSDVCFVKDLEAAIEEALGACGLEIRPPNPFGRAFRRLVGGGTQ